MISNVNITNTPIAPYLNLLDKLNRSEKIAIAAYIVDSLPGIQLVETAGENTTSAEDEAFLAEKLKSMTFSPRIEQLFKKRQEIAEQIDLEDERTRRILGL